jgi:hypothetical protein
MKATKIKDISGPLFSSICLHVIAQVAIAEHAEQTGAYSGNFLIMHVISLVFLCMQAILTVPIPITANVFMHTAGGITKLLFCDFPIDETTTLPLFIIFDIIPFTIQVVFLIPTLQFFHNHQKED